ncbi:hypothetical protein ACVU7I_12105, partial [Patulibacter sp. S7RM1-6]
MGLALLFELWIGFGGLRSDGEGASADDGTALRATVERSGDVATLTASGVVRASRSSAPVAVRVVGR